mmetsp:Transcript_13577/g.39150  ORF Transcript_13577/g.39150 Transcript_13577/m.39150 type:complete len:230 (-) Transcript_13577:261-950(-)
MHHDLAVILPRSSNVLPFVSGRYSMMNGSERRAKTANETKVREGTTSRHLGVANVTTKLNSQLNTHADDTPAARTRLGKSSVVMMYGKGPSDSEKKSFIDSTPTTARADAPTNSPTAPSRPPSYPRPSPSLSFPVPLPTPASISRSPTRSGGSPFSPDEKVPFSVGTMAVMLVCRWTEVSGCGCGPCGGLRGGSMANASAMRSRLTDMPVSPRYARGLRPTLSMSLTTR